MPPSEACTFGKLFVVTVFDGRLRWQRTETRNHLWDGGCRRVKCDHISGPNHDEFNSLPEGGILGQPDGLRVTAPERTGLGYGHGVVICVYTSGLTGHPPRKSDAAPQQLGSFCISHAFHNLKLYYDLMLVFDHDVGDEGRPHT